MDTSIDNAGTNVSDTTIVKGDNNNLTFSSIIQDNTGGVSSIRVLMLLWGFGVFLVWGAGAITCIYHGVYILPTLPPEIVTILLGVTGIKTCQRFSEK